MRILVVTSMLPRAQPTNAVPLVTYGLLAGLKDRHDVVLASTAGIEQDDEEAIALLQAWGVDVHAVWRRPTAGGRRWRRRWDLVSRWLLGRQPFRTAWYWEPEMQRLLDRMLTDQTFDLVVVEDNATGAYRLRTSKPVVLTEHEVRTAHPVTWRRRPGQSWSDWLFQAVDAGRWQRYQRSIWRRFDRIQVFTQRDALALDLIAPELAGRVRVNPFGIPLPSAADVHREEEGTILFVGGFTHPPNVDAALWLGTEIMPELRDLYPGVRLTIAGSYPPADILALNAEDIAVTGFVPKIEPLLERASVVVAPVRMGGGMRMKVLQSMAMGKAVVTTPLGAEGLLLDADETPCLLATSALEFAGTTAALLRAPAERHALGEAARAFVARKHTADAYARRLEAIYGELGR